MEELRAAPENMAAAFKLYRNLDALYDVLGSVTEGAGAFGTKDDLQALSNDLGQFESGRKQLAGRMENLANTKEAEIVRLRADLKTAQAAIPVEPPKKIVVDNTQPEKKGSGQAGGQEEAHAETASCDETTGRTGSAAGTGAGEGAVKCRCSFKAMV